MLTSIQRPSFPLQGSFVRQFAQEWVEGWNSHDLDRLLSHYDEEVEIVSPIALKLLETTDGLVRGRSAVREYFRRSLEAFPDLRFDVREVFWGVDTIVICYCRNIDDKTGAEVLQLSPDGKIRRFWANYDR